MVKEVRDLNRRLNRNEPPTFPFKAQEIVRPTEVAHQK